MHEFEFHNIPAVARRIACDEQASRTSALESKLAQQQGRNAELVSHLASAEEELENLRVAQAQELEGLTTSLASLSADAEGLKSTVAQRESAVRAVEEARAESEARLAEVTRQVEELRRDDAELSAEQELLNATIEKLRLENEALQSSIAAREVERLDDEKMKAKRFEELQTLTSSLASVSAEAEGLRLTIAERDSALRESAARLAEIAKHVEELERNGARLSATQEQLKATIVKLQLENEFLQSSNGAKGAARLNAEIAACRAVADRCLFVIGFARSYTTITLEMLNCAPNAYLLGEADFFLHDHGERFSAWYNRQHVDFRNQVTKSSHAPDFIPGRPHSWWEWLSGAAQFYDCIGEKIALSDYHLGKVPPDAFRAFYEARFLTSRYIFLLRNPVDSLLSSAKLLKIVDDEGMAKLCSAWLYFMQLWADFIRVFPRTMTIACEEFGERTVGDLEGFTGLDLPDAELLINPANKRCHKLTGKFPTLVRLRTELEELYADALAAADENKALWQAEQKRDAAANDTTGNTLGTVAMSPQALGRVWIRIQELRDAVHGAVNS